MDPAAQYLTAGANDGSGGEGGKTVRESWPHANYDDTLLNPVENFQLQKGDWKFKVESVVATWILFNAISTLMIITTNMKKAVSHEIITDYGEEKFDSIMGFIIYFPLVYFVLLVLLINNYFSEKAFYHYLKHGALIDFPASSGWGYLLKHPVPLIFLLFLLGYCGVAFYCMIIFKASVGTIAIFGNNLFIGVGLFWYRQQSIEWKFISISDFVQSFPDSHQAYGNIDSDNLGLAAHQMEKFTLIESDSTSYTSYMRNWWWKRENYSKTQMVLHHLAVLGVIGALAGTAFAYFFVLGRLDLQSRWNNEINPCIEGCIEGAWKSHEFTSISGSGSAFVADHSFCQYCTCQCLNNLRMKDEGTLEGCSDHFSPNIVGDAKTAALCPTPRTDNCPKDCGFKK